MFNKTMKRKDETPLLFRFLLVLAVIGILFTLLPTGSGVVKADYDEGTGSIGGGGPIGGSD